MYVTLIDVNDHAPKIRISPDPIEIVEEQNVNDDVAVGHVMVDDDDEGDNGRTDCGFAIDDDDDDDDDVVEVIRLVKVNEKVYKVFATRKLDREAQEKHQVVLYCWDHGVPSKNSSRVLHLLVKDVNDHPPIFQSSSYVVEVREDQTPGEAILKVVALDADEGDNAVVTYAITAGAGGVRESVEGAGGMETGMGGGVSGTIRRKMRVEKEMNGVKEEKKIHRPQSHTTKISTETTPLFKIDSKSGEISTTKSLDFEMVKHYVLQVTASDKAGGISVAMVTLNVVDVNDEEPLFMEEEYTYEVEENRRAGVVVSRLEAFDRDASSLFRHYNLSIESSFPPSDNGFFGMEGDQLVTRRMLDREQYSEHHLWVVATNTHPPHLSSTCHVNVLVTDTNDNAPLIAFPSPLNHTLHVPCHLAVGGHLSNVVAKDADAGSNATLEYYVVKGNEYVSVETTSGHVTLNSPVKELKGGDSKKRANQSETFKVSVTFVVKDNGHPSKSAEAVMTLVSNCSNTPPPLNPPPSSSSFFHFISTITGVSPSTLERLCSNEVVVVAMVALVVALVACVACIVCCKTRARVRRKKKQLLEQQQLQQHLFHNDNKADTLKVNNNVVTNSNGYLGNHYHVTPGSKLKDDNIRNEKLLLVTGKGSPKMEYNSATLSRMHDYHDSPTLEKTKLVNTFSVGICCLLLLLY